MNEAQRQSALQTMGIVSWFPRYTLPGAAPSTQASVTAEMFGIASAAEQRSPISSLFEEAESRTESRAVSGHVREALQSPEAVTGDSQVRAADSANTETRRIETSTPDRQVTAEALRFKSVYLPVSNKIAFLSELPLTSTGRLGSQHQRLFYQLVQTMAPTDDTSQLAHYFFQWPMIEIAGMVNSANAASAALSAFMEEHASGEAARVLVVMGQRLHDTLFENSRDQWQSRVVSTWSLDQMLKLPALKREAWLTVRSAI